MLTLRFARALMATAACIGFAATGAAAQDAMYPGQGIVVNPHAILGAGHVLYYPGGTAIRVQPPLFQPGARAERITLVPPGSRRSESSRADTPYRAPPPAMAARERPQAPVTSTAQPRREETPPPAASEARVAARSAAVPFALTPTSNDVVVRAPGTRAASEPPSEPPPSPAAEQPSVPPPEPRAEPRETVTAARIEPTRAETGRQSKLAKRTEIVFAGDAVEPAPSTVSELRTLAGDLSVTLRNGAGRVQLEAFGGKRGDKSSNARRLSLKRALAVRALLIESGVPSDRIDVRALGGADDGGTADRVDVFVRAS